MVSKWKTAITIFIIAGFIKVTIGSAAERVSGCGDVSPTITINCPGSTINIIKGVCVRVPSCDAYNPSLESQCDSDKTAQWAAYCRVFNPCILTGSCQDGQSQTCPGYYTYIYADYECISDQTSPGPTPTSELPSLPPVSDPALLQANVVRQKNALFRQIQERRLENHVIETRHGLSLVKCGAACNQLDDCVSFNIGNGVCELTIRW